MTALSALARVATAGLSRVGAPPPPATAGEALVPEKPDNAARTVLLRAGALALESAAGWQPLGGVKPPAPSPPDTLDPCPPAAEALIAALFEGATDGLLQDALEVLAERDAVLPAHLLPAALGCNRASERRAVRPVLGARGRWLASNTPGDAWAWAVGSPGADGPGHPTDSDPAVLKRTFDEAGLEERLSALRRVRSTEPAQGRAWLEAALAAEKPEVRARLLECLAVGLTDDDQTYLEGVLKDRAATVRLTAVELLLRLPGSPTAARHRGRMIDCVHLDPREGLVVTLPDAWLAEKQWTTDALPSTPPAATQATGQATGLKQQATAALVGRVPPGFWGVSFGLSLPLFLEVAQRSDFAEALLVGLVRSICLFGPPKDVDLRPLLRAVLFPVEQRVSGTPEIGSLLPTLLAHLSADVLSEIACAAIGRSVWSEVEAALPRPWPEPVALAFLQYARRPERQAQSDWDAFWQSLSTVALRLPRTCLDHPLAQLPDPTNTAHAHTTRNFNELVATRRRIRLEIGGY